MSHFGPTSPPICLSCTWNKRSYRLPDVHFCTPTSAAWKKHTKKNNVSVSVYALCLLLLLLYTFYVREGMRKGAARTRSITFCWTRHDKKAVVSVGVCVGEGMCGGRRGGSVKRINPHNCGTYKFPKGPTCRLVDYCVMCDSLYM